MGRLFFGICALTATTACIDVQPSVVAEQDGRNGSTSTIPNATADGSSETASDSGAAPEHTSEPASSGSSSASGSELASGGQGTVPDFGIDSGTSSAPAPAVQAATAVQATGLPGAASNALHPSATLSSVDGATVVRVKRAASVGDCALNAGYSEPQALGGGLSLDLTAVVDGEIYLCALGSVAAVPMPDAAAAQVFHWTKDTQAPVVSAIAATTADGSYRTGATIDLSLTTSKPVTISGGTPTLALNSGGTAAYIDASGTALHFRYTVGAGDNAADLDAAGSLSLAGASAVDAAGNSLLLTLPTGAATAGALAHANAVVIDTAAASLAAVTLTATPAPTHVALDFSGATAAAGSGHSFLVLRVLTSQDSSAVKPAGGSSYTPGDALGAGVVIAIGTGLTADDTNVTAAAAYTYRVYAFDVLKNYGLPASATATVPTASYAWSTEPTKIADSGGTADADTPIVRLHPTSGAGIIAWIQKNPSRYAIFSAAQSTSGAFGSPEVAYYDAAADMTRLTFDLDAVGNAAYLFRTGGYLLGAAQRGSAAMSWTTPNFFNASGVYSSPQVVATGTNRFAAAWYGSTSGPYIINVSLFDGTSWTTPVLMPQAAGASGHQVYPHLAVNSAGKGMITFTQNDGTADSLYACSLTISGATATLCTTPTLIESNAAAILCDASCPIVIDENGDVLTAWEQASGAVNHVYAATKTALGSWTTPTDLNQDPTHAAQGPRLAVQADNSVVISLSQTQPTGVNAAAAAWTATDTIPVAVIYNGSFGTPRLLADVSGVASSVRVAARNGHAVFGWSWKNGSIFEMRALTVASLSAATWDLSKTVVVSGTPNWSASLKPELAIDDLGRATVVWRPGAAGAKDIYANRFD